MTRMFESAQQAGVTAPAADIREAISRQREMLTDLLTVTMFKVARRLAPLIDMRHTLELLLIDEIEHMRYRRSLFVLDGGGSQIQYCRGVPDSARPKTATRSRSRTPACSARVSRARRRPSAWRRCPRQR